MAASGAFVFTALAHCMSCLTPFATQTRNSLPRCKQGSTAGKTLFLLLLSMGATAIKPLTSRISASSTLLYASTVDFTALACVFALDNVTVARVLPMVVNVSV
jgi:hypothetical protein